jgi:hypothetical protein
MCLSFRMFYQQFHSSECCINKFVSSECISIKCAKQIILDTKCYNKKFDSSECSNTATDNIKQGMYVQPGGYMRRQMLPSGDVREGSGMCRARGH